MSILNVNKINPIGGGSTITIAGIASVTNNISVGNSVTAASFVGPIEGNVTGNVTGNLTGTASTSTNAATAYAIDSSASLNTSGIVTATSFVPTVGQLSHRNIIVNGDMTVAQRGSSATLGGIHTVDRFGLGGGGFDETPTQSQVDVASGTTPYTLGFRKAFRITNGNQTDTGSTDRSNIYYNVESQDIANSGWNYKSASSFITLSYWVKSSVSQNFFHRIYSYDSPSQGFCWETGTLSANTWTKITKTIPGNSNLVFDNNNEAGLYMVFSQYIGTNYANDKTLDTWAAFASDNRTPTYPTTWWTTNDATFEMTGVQLEVGSVATPFEHRTFADELRRCSRYYQKIAEGNQKAVAFAFNYNAQYADWVLQYPMGPMRASPSIDMVTGNDYYHYHGGSQTCNLDGAFIIEQQQNTQANIYFDPDAGLTAGGTGYIKTHNAAAYFGISAEL